MGVWPDNVVSVGAFVAMSTQWRAGMGGATGLDYAAMPAVLRMTQVPRADWPEVFDAIRVMESVALDTMRKDK